MMLDSSIQGDDFLVGNNSAQPKKFNPSSITKNDNDYLT